MGTDIHLYVEKLVDGVWQIVAPPEKPKDAEDQWWECFYATSCHGRYDSISGDEIECPHTLSVATGATCEIVCGKCLGSGRDMRWYHNRNYNVFAVLAGLRNYDNLKPIAAPRGCPDDASNAVRYGNCWDHTPSWLLVSELLAYNWSRDTVCTGLLSMEEYKRWRRKKKRERPTTGFCRGTNGKTVSEKEAEELLKSSKRHDNIYVKVSWTESANNSCDDFVEFVNKYLVPVGPPNQVRIVFGFDS